MELTEAHRLAIACSILVMILHHSPATGVPLARLVGTDSSSIGRLEVDLGNNTWSTVCDDNFSDREAKVACRMAGLPDVHGRIIQRAGQHIPIGSGLIALDDLVCVGNETSLMDCRHSGIAVHNCMHFEDVALSCLADTDATTAAIVLSEPMPNDNQGVLKLTVNGINGTICSVGFDEAAATVACRWLGKNFVRARTISLRSQQRGRILLAGIRCRGNETTLLECSHSDLLDVYCYHTSDVAVSCDTDEMLQMSTRLLQGATSNEGQVEVSHTQGGVRSVGLVCSDHWTDTEAWVACRGAGLTQTTYAIPNEYISAAAPQMFLSDVRCNGTEPSLGWCQYNMYSSSAACSVRKFASVMCLQDEVPGNIPVRLVGGATRHEGRVEIRIAGRWGTVCAIGFDNRDARVLCMQAGYSRGGESLVNRGSGSGPIYVSDLSCYGNESSIVQCAHKSWGHTGRCTHGTDAHIRCYPDPSPNITVQLIDGPNTREGKLQVVINVTVTGGVCPAGWTDSNAAVVCRMMGYSTNGASGFITPGSDGVTRLLTNVSCIGTETELKDCAFSWTNEGRCIGSGRASVVCTMPDEISADVRVNLMNGSNPYEGTVQVMYNGTWGTICDNNWSNENAQVICHMLGYARIGSRVNGFSSYGDNNDHYILNEANCYGNESSIAECAHSGWHVNSSSSNCNRYVDAGVRCTGNVEVSNLRLVDGTTRYEGRVEIYHAGEWGTICGRLTQQDAIVICKQIGIETDSVIVHNIHYYGRGSGRIWLRGVACSGNEDGLDQCPHADWEDGQFCTHDSDASVACLPAGHVTPVRLVGGQNYHEGRVELQMGGVWGTVCHTRWSQTDAGVVCNMLGFPRGGALSKRYAFFGRGSGPIHLAGLTCRGGETSLLECPSQNATLSRCTHTHDAGAICSTGGNVTARLVGGASSNEGRVEVRIRGEWGTVCDDSFDDRDARVICRMIGLPTDGAVVVSQRTFSAGTGTIWLDEVGCRGGERQILQCSHPGLAETDCRHPEDVGIRCLSAPQTTPSIPETTTTPFDPDDVIVRLVNGATPYEGRIEVYFNGEFGTVCERGWDSSDAMVVCSMLGYPRTNAGIRHGAFFGRGTGDVILADVQCNGRERNLAQCTQRSSWQVHRCNHDNDVGVVCSAQRPDNFVMAVDAIDNAIYRLDLRTDSYVTIPHDNHQSPFTLALDPVASQIYWTDTGSSTIKVANMDGSHPSVFIALSRNASPEGLALDPISRNVFFTDRTREVITVASMDGSASRTLLRNMSHPQGITIHPRKGLIFWTNFAVTPQIERANMDGSGRTVIVSSDVMHPSQMTIDYLSNRIYWCDSGLRRIESASLDGSNRTVVRQLSANSIPFGIAIVNKFLYYTDWDKRSILRINKITGQDKVRVGPPVFNTLRGILVQKNGVGFSGQNACTQNRGLCSHVCVPATGGRGKVCLCPNGWVLGKDRVTCRRKRAVVTCPGFAAPENGILVGCGSGPSSARSMCAQECNDRYILGSGDRVRTCLPSGAWSGQLLNCTKLVDVTCAAFASPMNGILLGCDSGPSKMGSMCEQACGDGYIRSSGNLVRKCLSSATWSGLPLNCTKSVSDPLHHDKPDTGVSASTIALAVLLSLVVVTLVAFILFYIKRNRTVVLQQQHINGHVAGLDNPMFVRKEDL